VKRFPTFQEVSSITTEDIEFMNFMKRDSHKEVLEAIVESNYYNDDDGYINFLLESVVQGGLHHKLFEGTLTNDELYPILLERYVNEAKIKDWFMKKKEQVAGWIENGAERAKEKGVQLINKFKSFGDVVKIIKDSVAGFLKAAWDIIKKSAAGSLNKYKDELVEKWKHWTEKDEESVLSEIKHFGQMGKSTVTWATSGFPKEAQSAAQEVGNEDSETQDKEEVKKEEVKKESYNYADVLEQSLYIAFAELIKEDVSIIDEAVQFNKLMNSKNNPEAEATLESFKLGVFNSINEETHAVHSGFEIPFIGKIVHKLAHVKPFVYLQKIEKWVGEKVNNMFHKISIWVNKFASGPEPYKYNYLGESAGFTAGAQIKSGLNYIIDKIGKASIGVAIAAMVPGLSWILTMMNWIAKGIWYVEVGQLGVTAVGHVTAASKKSKDDKNEKPSDEVKDDAFDVNDTEDEEQSKK
jgi:hypothetical protein